MAIWQVGTIREAVGGRIGKGEAILVCSTENEAKIMARHRIGPGVLGETGRCVVSDEEISMLKHKFLLWPETDPRQDPKLTQQPIDKLGYGIWQLVLLTTDGLASVIHLPIVLAGSFASALAEVVAHPYWSRIEKVEHEWLGVSQWVSPFVGRVVYHYQRRILMTDDGNWEAIKHAGWLWQHK